MPKKSQHSTQRVVTPVVRRTVDLGSVIVSVVETDIVQCKVDTIVNAANMLSFMPMDGGVSGALRNACKPEKVTGALKKWWDEEGREHNDKKLATTQAGVQPAAGALRERGVVNIVHAVGPIWADYPIKDTTFKLVTKKIKRTVRRALSAADRVGACKVALPAISGGIFTHYKEGTDIKEREQAAAREAVVQAVFSWVRKNSGASSIRAIHLVDLPRSSKGCVHLFVEAFDKVLARSQHQKEARELEQVMEEKKDEVRENDEKVELVKALDELTVEDTT